MDIPNFDNRGVVASQGDSYSAFDGDNRPWPVRNISAENFARIVSQAVQPSTTANVTPPVPLYNAVSGSERIVTNGRNTAVTFGEPPLAAPAYRGRHRAGSPARATRARAGSGGDTLIAGFVIADGTKRVLIRAIGPTLSAFGVTGALADPQLSVYSGSSLHALNDDWGGGPVLKDAFTRARRLRPAGGEPRCGRATDACAPFLHRARARTECDARHRSDRAL